MKWYPLYSVDYMTGKQEVVALMGRDIMERGIMLYMMDTVGEC